MGRRARGEGSVFKRWDKRLNRYQWMVQITLEDGQQKQYRVKNQEEGVKLLKKLQRDLEQGTLVTGPKQTIKQYLEYWLEEVHRSSIKISTYVKYRKVINGYIIPALGHLTLEKLTPQHVKSLYNKKEKEGLAPKTIHSIHGVLHKALDNAVLWNMVARNVCNVVKPPRLVKKERQSLTMDQAHTLLESVRGQRLEMLLTLALVTGMRRGELLALRWSDLHGGYFNPRYLEKTFSKLITDAGLPRISFHNLRHSAATLLRGMGIDIKLIQEILGHSNFATTADIYSHVLPSMRKEAANKWDDEFRDNGLGGVGVE